MTTALGAAALILAWSGAAGAALIAADGFESYGIGQLESGAGIVTSGGTGNWDAPWDVDDTVRGRVDIVAHSMTYSNAFISISGGSQALRLRPNADKDTMLSREFATQTGTLYLSFLLQAPTITDIVSPNNTNDFFQFGLDAAKANPRASGGIADQSGGQRFFARSTTTSGNTTFGAAQVDPAATYLVVLKVSKTAAGNYDRVDLYVNPASDIEGDHTPITRTNDSGMSALNYFVFRTYRHEDGDAYYIDNVRIGDSFADVVPEPATLALAALGGLALAARRRAARA